MGDITSGSSGFTSLTAEPGVISVKALACALKQGRD